MAKQDFLSTERWLVTCKEQVAQAFFREKKADVLRSSAHGEAQESYEQK